MTLPRCSNAISTLVGVRSSTGISPACAAVEQLDHDRSHSQCLQRRSRVLSSLWRAPPYPSRNSRGLGGGRSQPARRAKAPPWREGSRGMTDIVPYLQQFARHCLGTHDVPCPVCGPERRSPINQRRKVLRVWQVTSTF